MSSAIADFEQLLNDDMNDIAREMSAVATEYQAIETQDTSEHTLTDGIAQDAKLEGLKARYNFLQDMHTRMLQRRWDECGTEPYDDPLWRNRHIMFEE